MQRFFEFYERLIARGIVIFFIMCIVYFIVEKLILKK